MLRLYLSLIYSVAQYRSIGNESLIMTKQRSKDTQCYTNCVNCVLVASEFGVKWIQGSHFWSAQGSKVL